MKKIIAGTYEKDAITFVRMSNEDVFNRPLTLRKILRNAYQQLSKSYRCEYFYKNSIVNELLKKNHDPRTSSFFTEFKVGNGWSDLVVANGFTTSYEIKTELDSLSRLNNQVAANLKMFERNYVVTFEENLEKVLKIIDDKVGILIIDNFGKMSSMRKAEHNRSIDPIAIFNSLRRKEYLQILDMELGFNEKLPNTKIYAACRDIFSTLDHSVIQNHFKRVLQERRDSQIVRNVERSPAYLKLLFLTNTYNEESFRRICVGLNRAIN